MNPNQTEPSLFGKGIYLKTILTFVFLVTVSAYLARQDHQITIDQQHNVILNQASHIRANLEHHVNTSLNLTQGMLVYVAHNPDISTAEFERLAKRIMHSTPLLRNVALAPDNVITHIYPLKGNEKAIGLRYLEHSEQREAVLRAINTKSIVIAGPVNLVQGGSGFISRIPIFLDEQQEHYWGIASIVIDIEVLYELSGLLQQQLVEYGLKGQDSLGKEGEIFFGDKVIFSEPSSIILPIKLPTGNWFLGARFRHQDVAFSTRTIIVFISGVMISGALSLLLFLLLNAFQRVKHIAAYDSLTGLANRHLFQDYLEKAIAQFQRNKIKFALLMLDLDHFKEINDTLGHPVGDRLLKAVAKRLVENSRKSDVVARLGGDEFIILQHNLSDQSDTVQFAKKILSQFEKVFEFKKTQLQTSASIGIVISDDNNMQKDLLMKNADLALYDAKLAGRSTYSIHNDSMSQSLMKELEIFSDLLIALDKEQFFLVYQPQFNLADKRLIGVEALIRWNHPDKGFISPADFIPVAEKRGLIEEIGVWSVNEICRQGREWIDNGQSIDKLALNISAQHIKSPNFYRQIETALAEYELPASYLKLELTESVFVDDFDYIKKQMQYLEGKGITFAIDDFGTGYSSLAYLKNLNVRYLKIDQTFVRDMLADQQDVEIIKATIEMAKALQLLVIAEGIEEEAQAELLGKMGCDFGQGYWFSKPIPPKELTDKFLDQSQSHQ
jgi:diguanylate cyclase (GGDEF)-like protein